MLRDELRALQSVVADPVTKVTFRKSVSCRFVPFLVCIRTLYASVGIRIIQSGHHVSLSGIYFVLYVNRCETVVTSALHHSI